MNDGGHPIWMGLFYNLVSCLNSLENSLKESVYMLNVLLTLNLGQGEEKRKSIY